MDKNNKAQYLHLSFLTVLFFLVSCAGSRNGSDTDSVISDSLISEQIDSVTGKPFLKFKSSSEAIQYMKNSGHWDKYSKGILPRMAQDERQYVENLLNDHHGNFIIVDKAKMKVFLYDAYGRIIKSYGMACARNYGTKHRRGDSCTPEGYFTAEGIYNSSEWLYTDDFGNTSQTKGMFGPKFIRVKVPGTNAIGIHGTASPGSIGGRRSHGCIRLTNDNILDLAPRVKKGVPIIISPGPKDMAYNDHMGCYVPPVVTEPGGTLAVKADKVPHNYYEQAPKKTAVVKDSLASSEPQEISTETPAPSEPSEPQPEAASAE